MSDDALIRSLQTNIERLQQGAVVVGFSGGLDSTVLLHALANVPEIRSRGLRALHIDHALHADSSRWADHCRAFAGRLDVPIDIVTVTIDAIVGNGLEDAARSARLSAFEKALRKNEILALAHHGDDQAETVLLKLLRGAGPEGLAGMRHLRLFGKGYLWRPLLGIPRQMLRDYASHHALTWLDDPSNENRHLRRNFLRHEILPRLRSHWPNVEAALAHSAEWLRAAADFIETNARSALTQIRGTTRATLQWKPWLALPDALRDPVLRLWLRELALPEPAHFHVTELERQLRAAQDRNPHVGWEGAEMRRYRDELHAMKPLGGMPPNWQTDWNGEPIDLPDGGRLSIDASGCTAMLHIRYRRGGEVLKRADGHHRPLRAVLQDQAIPPWLRDRIPLIYLNDELLCVGDIFLSAPGLAWCVENRARFLWERGAGQAAPPIASATHLG